MKTHDTINGKTPEEIKKGMECCVGNTRECMQCPYPIGFECFEQPMKDAIAYIQQLESRLAQAERERDAAVNDCGKFLCNTCRYNGYAGVCYICHNVPGGGRANYEWRGICPENTKEGNTDHDT